jgi:hypothetical protein
MHVELLLRWKSEAGTEAELQEKVKENERLTTRGACYM